MTPGSRLENTGTAHIQSHRSRSHYIDTARSTNAYNDAINPRGYSRTSSMQDSDKLPTFLFTPVPQICNIKQGGTKYGQIKYFVYHFFIVMGPTRNNNNNNTFFACFFDLHNVILSFLGIEYRG